MIKLIFMLIFLISNTIKALPNNQQQTIHVNAQSVLIDEKNNNSVYTGNASVIQGALMLNAENIHVFNNQTGVVKIIAKGDKKNRAVYKQNEPNQANFIKANANKITYLIETEMIHLRGNVYLLQGSDTFSGGALDYDIKQDKVVAQKVKGDSQGVRLKIKL